MTALFRYKAVDRYGRLVSGDLAGADRAAVVTALQNRGAMPVEVEPVGPDAATPTSWWERILRPRRFQARAFVEWCDQFGHLLQANIELDAALRILGEATTSAGLRRLTAELQDALRGGSSFSNAILQQREALPESMAPMIEAGEISGALAEVMSELAAQQLRELEAREALKSALVYPATLATVATISVVVIVTVVLPALKSVLEGMGSALPWMTRMVLGFGEFLRHWGLVLLAVLIATALIGISRLKDPKIARLIDEKALALPGIGDYLRDAAAAQLARVLSMLLRHGVTIDRAFPVAIRSVRNRALADRLAQITDQLRTGVRVSRALETASVMPHEALQMIKIGEETGALGGMLGKVAMICERRVHYGTQRFLALLEPALILLLAVVIGTIVFSLLLAIMSMNDLPL